MESSNFHNSGYKKWNKTWRLRHAQTKMIMIYVKLLVKS